MAVQLDNREATGASEKNACAARSPHQPNSKIIVGAFVAVFRGVEWCHLPANEYFGVGVGEVGGKPFSEARARCCTHSAS